MQIDIALQEKNKERPLEIRGWYRVVRAIIRLLLRLLVRLEVEGQEHIPDQGPYLYLTNHLHWLDAPTLMAVFPHRANVFAAAPLLVPVAFLFCITGAWLGIQRLLGYSLMLTAVLVVGQLTRPPPPLAMLIPGAFILANGWSMLNTFLDENPLPEVEGAEEVA